LPVLFLEFPSSKVKVAFYGHEQVHDTMYWQTEILHTNDIHSLLLFIFQKIVFPVGQEVKYRFLWQEMPPA